MCIINDGVGMCVHVCVGSMCTCICMVLSVCICMLVWMWCGGGIEVVVVLGVCVHVYVWCCVSCVYKSDDVLCIFLTIT